MGSLCSVRKSCLVEEEEEDYSDDDWGDDLFGTCDEIAACSEATARRRSRSRSGDSSMNSSDYSSDESFALLGAKQDPFDLASVHVSENEEREDVSSGSMVFHQGKLVRTRYFTRLIKPEPAAAPAVLSQKKASEMLVKLKRWVQQAEIDDACVAGVEHSLGLRAGELKQTLTDLGVDSLGVQVARAVLRVLCMTLLLALNSKAGLVLPPWHPSLLTEQEEKVVKRKIATEEQTSPTVSARVSHYSGWDELAKDMLESVFL